MSRLKELALNGSRQEIEEYVDWARSNPQTFIAQVARLMADPQNEVGALIRSGVDELECQVCGDSGCGEGVISQYSVYEIIDKHIDIAKVVTGE